LYSLVSILDVSPRIVSTCFSTFLCVFTGKVFKQKYHGNLTLVPRFTAMQTFGLAALVNPTVNDMENYLKFGQIAAWPYLR
jgi:hypothetical protein